METPFDPALPFAILWDNDCRAARLFTNPRGEIRASGEALLAALRAASGDWIAGGLGYEALFTREPRLATLAQGETPIWFGRFAEPVLLDGAALQQLLSGWRRNSGWGAIAPETDRAAYMRAVRDVQDYIASGDIYQANLTFPAKLDFHGHPLSLFARLFRPEHAPHGGIVHDGKGRWWISLSPELFFTLADGILTARPMKGTAARLGDARADAQAAQTLQQDVKNRAENLMITDLLRNDLAHVSRPGSVRVPELFHVAPFANVHQMTSRVTAELAAGRDAVDALAALFPCGSITGAPKFRAMEIIRELEPGPRGIFYGSLGWIAPHARAAHFNVAIRTVEVRDGAARLALGAGIVADSEPGAEWEECLAKGGYLHNRNPQTLIETMRVETGRISRLSLHLDRMERSARRFDFRFYRNKIEIALHRISATGRLRLLLAPDGATSIQLSGLPARPAVMQVGLASLPLAPEDWRLSHKTNDRDHWPKPQPGTQETIFIRRDGLLTEGSFTNIFLERGGMLLTPPVHLGLLPGVLRAELIANGAARESLLRVDDLQQGFLIGNSLRGLMPARLAT